MSTNQEPVSNAERKTWPWCEIALWAIVGAAVFAWVTPTEIPPTTYRTDATGFGTITDSAGLVTLTDRYGEMDR